MAVDQRLNSDQVDLDSLVHRHVVQGEKDAVVDPRLEQGSALQREVAGRPTLECLLLFAELDLSEEAQAAGVDSQDRNMGGCCLLRSPEQGAVAPDADDQAGAVQLARERAGALSRRREIGPPAKAAGFEPRASLHHRSTADVDPWMADDANRVSHLASDGERTRDCP